jgi:alkane 1-monooxygenase
MGYLLAYAVPGIVIGSVWLGQALKHPDAFAWTPLVFAYVVIPTIQAAWQRGPFRLSPEDERSPAWTRYYRLLPVVALPAQLAMLLVATQAFATGPYSPLGRIGLLLGTSLFGALFAINLAHELMHRRQRFDRACAGLLLSTVSFGTFKIVHLQVHHPYVGTPLDFATARRGQSIYSFWRQSFVGNVREAIRCERQRLARSGKAAWTSELVLWYALTAAWLTIATAWYGWVGGLFFLLQSAMAIMSLDVANYMQHYGLTRRLLPGNRPEPIQYGHSWSQERYLDDFLLVNLPRHADHHLQPQRPFQLLRDTSDAPHYPLNYGLTMASVFVPPLFRYLAHPVLDAFEARRRDGAVSA